MKKILMIFFILSMFSFSLNEDSYDYRFDVSVTVKEKDTGIEIVQLVNGIEHIISGTIEFEHGKGKFLVNGETIPDNFINVIKTFRVKLTNHNEGYVQMSFDKEKVSFNNPNKTNLEAEYSVIINGKRISNGDSIEIMGSKGLDFDIESLLKTNDDDVVKAVPGVSNYSDITTLTITFNKTE